MAPLPFRDVHNTIDCVLGPLLIRSFRIPCLNRYTYYRLQHFDETMEPKNTSVRLAYRNKTPLVVCVCLEMLHVLVGDLGDLGTDAINRKNNIRYDDTADERHQQGCTEPTILRIPDKKTVIIQVESLLEPDM